MCAERVCGLVCERAPAVSRFLAVFCIVTSFLYLACRIQYIFAGRNEWPCAQPGLVSSQSAEQTTCQRAYAWIARDAPPSHIRGGVLLAIAEGFMRRWGFAGLLPSWILRGFFS